MLINVYSQELTGEVFVVTKKTSNGRTYHGVRMVLDSSPKLYNKPDDDDRSAITFWIQHSRSFSKDDLCDLFGRLALLVNSCPEPAEKDND